MSQKRTCALVLGMHRSGTSLVAAMLARLGAAPPEDVFPARPDNPTGFWEPRSAVQANDAILRQLGSSWHDFRPTHEAAIPQASVKAWIADLTHALQTSFGEAPLFVLKDPRMCRLLWLWLPALAAASVAPRALLVLRHPDDVTTSLVRRNGLTRDYWYRVWIGHVLEAERQSRTLSRMVLQYEDVVARPFDAARTMGSFLHGGRTPFLDVEGAVRLVDPALNHAEASAATDGTEMAIAARTLYDRLTSWRGDPQSAVNAWNETARDDDSSLTARMLHELALSAIRPGHDGPAPPGRTQSMPMIDSTALPIQPTPTPLWTSDNECTVMGTTCRYIPERSDRQTDENEIVLLKPRTFFDYYARLVGSRSPANVVELGIFEGGSGIVLASMWPDAKVIGIDIRPPSKIVARHLDRLSLSTRLRFYYDTSQDDSEAVLKIIDAETSKSPLDLVIDDASHFYSQSKRSFEILFPLLRPGCSYVIEDWAWALWRSSSITSAWIDKPPLVNLIHEIIMVAGAFPEIIPKVTITRGHVAVVKGHNMPVNFSLDELCKVEARDWHGLSPGRR